ADGFFLSLSLLPPVLHGAGMDCRRAASVPEKAICTDDGLRGLDAHLGKVYAQALRYDPASAKALRDSQRQWLQRRNDCGE
ncbi:lysozyme inhibitor LprI family protein, partial [Pseudomonas aeruginosa]|uniref:lysozyme inhibitor LprI family protein n=1 Tax=Pseudomonas aeruginosa TaxID=287 RepID=UPI0026F05546